MEKWGKNKKYIIITSLTVLVPMIAGIILWKRLPDKLATNWGYDGTPNSWESKEFAVFGLPLLCLLVHLVCTVATMADPKESRIGDKMFRLVLLICPVVSLMCSVFIYGTALSLEMDVSWITQMFLGVLLIVIGNYMPKCRQNYTVGIKLPWTLADEENWNRTHRLAGWLWVGCGALVVINGFADFLGTYGIPAVFIVMILVPAGYSFMYYLKHKN